MSDKKDMMVEGEPTKRFKLSYGGDFLGSFATVKELLAARARHDDLMRPVIDRKKKFRYAFVDGQKEVSIEQLHQMMVLEKTGSVKKPVKRAPGGRF